MSTSRARARDDRGAVSVVVALLTCGVLLVVGALTVDMGNTWARRGQLQHQADLAAKFAAEQLPVVATQVPVTPLASQLKVARAAAYYLACHPVVGQDALSPVPACPAAGTYLTDAAIGRYAEALLSNGRTHLDADAGAITFPAVNQVSLTTPAARVAFGLGRTVGSTGTVQTRTATAETLSPGNLLPVGLSLTCLANPLGTLPLGVGDTVSKVMPINYISTGRPGQTGGTPQNVSYTSGLTDWSDITNAYNNSAGSNTMTTGYPTITTSGVVTVSFDWRGNRNGWTVDSVRIYLRKVGYKVGDTTGLYESPEIDAGTLPTAAGTSTWSVALPAGTYEAVIRFTGRNGAFTQSQAWRANTPYPTFVVPETGELKNLVSCARPMLSPRAGSANGTDAGDREALAVNLARGLDHGLAAYPGLADLLDGLRLSSSAQAASTLSTLATNPSFAFECLTNPAVKLDYATRRTDGPNCVRVDTTRDWSDELTKGLLTGSRTAAGPYAGRLACPASGPCNHLATRPVLTDPGGITGRFNNDQLQDFIRKDAAGGPRYLSDPFFVSLDTYLHPSVPVVTPPNDTIEPGLYSSPRFFWAPVVSTAYVTTGAGKAADYPVLTFRPVFLTSDSSTQIQTPIDMLLLRLVNQAASGLTLGQVLASFGDPCPTLMGVLGLVSSLTGILGLSTSHQQACELELVKTAFSSSKYLSNLTSYAGSTTVTAGGLVIDSAAKRMRNARIMTVAPDALPAVPQTYSGPTVPYLGVGPKMVRLVR
jgi:hypothetical protein